MFFSLVNLNGPRPGTALRLDPESPEPVTLGRHPSRDLHVDDERASRLHARIHFRRGLWHLEDCDSLNGTHVNSQVVSRVILENGDIVKIGDQLVLFVDSSERANEATAAADRLHPTALMGRLPLDDPRADVVKASLGQSASQVVRDSAVLCRLANTLHESSDIDCLLSASLEALMDGVDADSISIWLVGTDGRLRCAKQWGDQTGKHLLASLAVEQGKAVLIDDLSDDDEQTVSVEDALVGMAIGVPIPGSETSRGAIECRRNQGRASFERHELDFSTVVAHQTGAALGNCEHRRRLEQANQELRRRLEHQARLVGSSTAMVEIHDQLARIGPTSSNVLVLGESGSGKELIARSIHELSQRKDGPYITVNCAAFSESLLESELFGHEVGAFTGADRRYIGQFERADHGTMFLDEVGEMSLACQAKLLRILEGHPFQRLGGQDSIQVNVRVIAATHRDLRELVAKKLFREDLYFRLRVIDLHVPPLRERGQDAVELAALFLDEFRGQMGRGPERFSREAIDAICRYRWPGNVRELRNAVERAIVLGRRDEVDESDLGLPSERAAVSPAKQLVSLEESSLAHIQFVLEQVGGNKSKACKILKIGRGTLYNKLNIEEDA